MRHNEVLLCGWVDIPPKVVKNEKTEEYEYAMGRIFTIRGVRRFGTRSDNVKYDEPLVYTHNVELCKQMESWKHGDIVQVKGSLVTKDVKKSTFCKCCGQKNSRPGTVTYVSPIFCTKIDACQEDKKKALEKLKDLCEISNYATIIGLVCRDPVLYKKGKTTITSYQLAVRRKFRIREDAEDAKTDFPWVKSYGIIGENDAYSIKKGSYIFVDGWIQARTFKRTEICPNCGESYEWTDSSQEIVPFATEYMKNCRTLEEINEEEKQRILNSYVAVFGRKENEEALIEQSGKPNDDIDDIMKTLDKYESYMKRKEEDESSGEDGEDSGEGKPVSLGDLL